jgi:hypothetical protein
MIFISYVRDNPSPDLGRFFSSGPEECSSGPIMEPGDR